MRRCLCFLLCLVLSGLLAGCGEENPDPTTAPTEDEVLSSSLPTEEPTAPEEPTETYPEARLNTAVLLENDPALEQAYLLMAVSEDGPFLAQDVVLNRRGTDALVQWLMHPDRRDMIGDFGKETYGQSLFRLPDEGVTYTNFISRATASTATLRLGLDETLAETGLTDTLIPEFESALGYTVEIRTGSATAVCSAARNGYVDLVLVKSGDEALALADEGFIRNVSGFPEPQIPLLSMAYLLCGPLDDPAGAASCADVQAAFAAIAKAECTFTSRGDGSFVHTLEQQFWPKDTDFGSWYISADLEMGPCLVMNDIQGGYILTDKLTWLVFAKENGII